MSDRPLITLEEACIESGPSVGAPLSASGGTRLVALIGYFSPLFRLLRAEDRLRSGAVRFLGVPAGEALASGVLALASREAPGASWTLERYLLESARLTGLGRRQAKANVTAELMGFGLAGLGRQRLRDLPATTRRIASLARASLSRAQVLCAEAPLSDLDGPNAGAVLVALERVLSERALVISFPTPPTDGAAKALAERADFRVSVLGGRVLNAEPGPAKSA